MGSYNRSRILYPEMVQSPYNGKYNQNSAMPRTWNDDQAVGGSGSISNCICFHRCIFQNLQDLMEKAVRTIRRIFSSMLPIRNVVPHKRAYTLGDTPYIRSGAPRNGPDHKRHNILGANYRFFSKASSERLRKLALAGRSRRAAGLQRA